MSLHDKIHINTHYTRSVNLERDASSALVVDAYIPTSRAIRTLERIADALNQDESPRAWSLVGPYGSGKSSFALFLATLLGSNVDESTKKAKQKLKLSEVDLPGRFSAATRASEGYCTILLTGSPESLGRRLLRAMHEKAGQIWSARRGPNPAVISKLELLSGSASHPSTSEVMECVSELQDALSGLGYSGILIVMDELGKFLEYEARHYGANDIFLLQSLAEHALAPHDSKLAVVVMLHQAIEQYARGLGESLKNEWAKVQGRFENIPFLESSEQTLRVVSAAIEHDFSNREAKEITRQAKELARSFVQANALPSMMDEKVAAELFKECYPLHPVSALMLPILCQKVAQNERTLFSYLGSKENHGFRDSVERMGKVGDWIYPWEIYEYFILNQPAALSDHFTHRRWAEVVTAVERLGDSNDNESHILKTIGLFNIIGVQGGFKASKELIESCLPAQSAVKKAIKALTDQSIVHYRKFSSDYRVWQGSDFDLEEHVNDAGSKLGAFNLAEQLNQRHTLLPIVARRYTIDTGALRYFTPVFTDAASYDVLENTSSEPRIIIFLAERKDEESTFKDKVVSHFGSLDICVLFKNGDQLREVLTESLALEEVQRSAQALHTDPVAQREFRDRYSAASQREEANISRLLEYPEQGEWFYCGKLLEIFNKRVLQETLSKTLKSVFEYSPVVRNELINRDRPSSQANAAKNKLAAAMLVHEAEEGLCFEKYPPEKAIYKALFQVSKLHIKDDSGKWKFVAPVSNNRKDDPCNMYGVWQRVNEFLDQTEKTPQALISLNTELLAPPYGIKEGVLPLIFVAVILANQHELAIYEGRVFRPRFTEEMIDRFLKRPDEFTFQRFKIAGLNASIFKEYSKVLYGDGKTRDLLSIAKPIASFMMDLPEYTQKTSKGLSHKAKSIRDVFRLSKSPVDLLAEEVPKALGYALKERNSADNDVTGLSHDLTEVLRELKYCLSDLKDEMRQLFAQAFHLDKKIPLEELRKRIYGRVCGLEGYTIDRDGQKAFIQRLIQKSLDDESWFDGVLTFLGHKPTERWTDTERDGAEYRLVEFSKKIDDLEKLRVHYQSFDNKSDPDFDVYLLRSVKRGAPDYDAVVAVDSKRKNSITATKEKMYETISRLGDKELELAALAELVDEFLKDYRGATTKNPLKDEDDKSKEVV